MAKNAPIITRRRLLLGGVVAAAVAMAIALFGPGSSRGLYGASPFGKPTDRDLDAIRRDTLRVLVVRNHLVYEHAPGVESGMEYELLKRLAHELNVPIKAVPVARPDSLLPMLQRGVGDVISANLGQRNPVARWTISSLPYRYVAPVFTTLRPDPYLGLNTDLSVAPDTAWVSVWSTFAPRDLRFPGNDGKADLEKRTVFTDTSRFGDQAVINVALGHIRAAIVSDGSAAFFAKCFPQLYFSRPYAQPVPVVFGMRTNARDLQRAIDERLADPKKKEAMALLMSAYGTEIPERGAMPSVPCAGTTPALPPDIRMPTPPREGHDWGLLAAVVLQDERMDTTLTSTGDDQDRALDPGIAPRMDQARLDTTARFLADIDARWRSDVPDPDQRLRFVVAAWHAGQGHVGDARALAGKFNLDPRRWDGHVERAITLLALPRCFGDPAVKHGYCRGADTFIAVRDLVCRYEHFRAMRR